MFVHEISENHGEVARGAGERFGIELEVENARYPDELGAHWRVVEDGSLRNSGLEFVSNPLSMGQIDEAVPQFYQWMRDLGYATSIRTSTHVHANVLDHTMEELGAVFAAYAIVEPLLFQMCGSQREENIYCVPWYRAHEQAEVAGRALGGRRSQFRYSCKYSSMYIEPVVRFGTVEFRQAPLFESEGALRVWLELIRAIVYTAPRLWNDAQAVINAYDEGCSQFVESLFGPTLVDELSIYCRGSMEDIIDNADSLTIAEYLVPSLCTYKATGWVSPMVHVEGDAVRGYRNVAFRGMGSPMYMPEYDEDHDEYHDEEYDEEIY